MANEIPNNPFLNPEKGNEYFKNAKDLQQKGHFDAALREFRRAVIENPSIFEAWMEIGHLCKTRAGADKMFLRYSYEAYQKAVRLNGQSQEAHDQYITAGQRMGRLQEINDEYLALSKKFPDDPLIQRCFKNTNNLLLALMPEKVNLGQGGNKKIRGLLLIVSLGLIFVGVGFSFFFPVFLKGLKVHLTKELLNQFLWVGILMIILGIGGVITRSRIT